MADQVPLARSTAVEITNTYADNRLHLRAHPSSDFSSKIPGVQMSAISEIEGTDVYMGNSFSQEDINNRFAGFSYGLHTLCLMWDWMKKRYLERIKLKDEQILEEMKKANDMIPSSLGSKVCGTEGEIDAFWNDDAMNLDKHEWIRFGEYILSEIRRTDDKIYLKKELQLSRYVTLCCRRQSAIFSKRVRDELKKKCESFKEKISNRCEDAWGIKHPQPLPQAVMVRQDPDSPEEGTSKNFKTPGEVFFGPNHAYYYKSIYTSIGASGSKPDAR